MAEEIRGDPYLNVVIEQVRGMRADFDAAEAAEREREFDRAIGLTEGERNWARTADDCFCPCCGRRGAIGLCHSCEASGR